MNDMEREEICRLILARPPQKRSFQDVVRILSDALGKDRRIIQAIISKPPVQIAASKNEEAMIDLFEQLKRAGAELLIQKSSDPSLYCSFHPINITDSKCRACGRNICDRCIVQSKGKELCLLCYRKEKIRRLKRRTRHLFLFFLFSAFIYFVYQFLQLEEIDFFSGEPLTGFIYMTVEDGDLLREKYPFFKKISRGGKDSFKGVEGWFRDEFKRITRLDKNIITLDLKGPFQVKRFPFSYNEDPGTFVLLWNNLSLLHKLRNLAEDFGINFDSYNIRLYVLFHPKEHRFSHELSMGSYKRHVGLIHLPIEEGDIPYSVVTLLHEMCHTLGASDKYDPDSKAIFPEGYAEPYKDPLFPQDYGEIMAVDIPLSREMEREPAGLEEVRMGIETAYEIGWVNEESYKRYYEEF